MKTEGRARIERSPSNITAWRTGTACGALLPVLLALVRARVTRKKAELLQPAAQLRVELDQSAGNTQPRGAGLADEAAAIGEDQDVELVGGFGREQAAAAPTAREVSVVKYSFERPAVDRDGALAGPQEHTSDRRLPAAGAEILNQSLPLSLLLLI